MRTSGLLQRLIAATLAIFLASPCELTPSDFESAPSSTPSTSAATSVASLSGLRLKSPTSRRYRLACSPLPDQDDLEDGASQFRPVVSAIRSSNSPLAQFAAATLTEKAVKGPGRSLGLTRLCRLRC